MGYMLLLKTETHICILGRHFAIYCGTCFKLFLGLKCDIRSIDFLLSQNSVLLNLMSMHFCLIIWNKFSVIGFETSILKLQPSLTSMKFNQVKNKKTYIPDHYYQYQCRNYYHYHQQCML